MKTFIQPLFTALTLSSILIAAPSQAQPKDPEIDCKNAKTQLEMNLCAAQSFKVADTELNQIYRQLRTHYKGTKQAPQFLNAQLAWLKFRRCRLPI